MGFIIAYAKYAVFSMTRMYRRILDYKGRTNRQEFWWGFAYYLIITIAGEIYTVNVGATTLWFWLNFVYALFVYLTIGALVMSVIRRLHDANRSGWAILVIVIPIVGFFILLFLMLLKSEDGPNTFGPKPLHWQRFAL